MNFLKNSTSEALYAMQVFLAVAIAIVVIIISFRAYRQTRFAGFLFWIYGSLLTLCTIIAWDVVGHSLSYPQLYPAAVIAYRAMFLINSLLSFAGTVLVVREFVRLFRARKI